MTRQPTHPTLPPLPPGDRIGFRFFTDGAMGEAHAMAHELLDGDREAEGYERLGAWLEAHPISGSEGIHLHWHQAVFEIAVGRVHAAHRRYLERIAPHVPSGGALTDAPSLLWRLWLACGGAERLLRRVGASPATAPTLGGGAARPNRSISRATPKPSADRAPAPLELDWTAVRDVARERVATLDERPYVQLHQLLALAGARDTSTIDRWLDGQYRKPRTPQRRFLLRLAWGLRTFANRDFSPSARLLAGGPEVAALGGSGAQNELFDDLRSRAARLGRLVAA